MQIDRTIFSVNFGFTYFNFIAMKPALNFYNDLRKYIL